MIIKYKDTKLTANNQYVLEQINKAASKKYF
jgi:hypothetical protein